MDILVGDIATVEIRSLHGDTFVTGPVVQIGIDTKREGLFYFQIAGITSTFWSDEIFSVTKNG